MGLNMTTDQDADILYRGRLSEALNAMASAAAQCFKVDDRQGLERLGIARMLIIVGIDDGLKPGAQIKPKPPAQATPPKEPVEDPVSKPSTRKPRTAENVLAAATLRALVGEPGGLSVHALDNILGGKLTFTEEDLAYSPTELAKNNPRPKWRNAASKARRWLVDHKYAHEIRPRWYGATNKGINQVRDSGQQRLELR